MAFNDTLKSAEKFGAIWNPMPYFHLRPKSDGATLVCTIPRPRIAMRGKQTGVHTLITKQYNELLTITPDMNDALILTKLKEWRFSVRESDKKEEEKLIQAMFINLLFDNKNALVDCGYSNVNFIASELVYPITGEAKRLPDVIAETNEYILLIEIKKGGDKNPGDDLDQLVNYKKAYFDDNCDKTIALLKAYPNHGLSGNKPVLPVYLLSESDKSPSFKKDGVAILRFKTDGSSISVHR